MVTTSGYSSVVQQQEQFTAPRRSLVAPEDITLGEEMYSHHCGVVRLLCDYVEDGERLGLNILKKNMLETRIKNKPVRVHQEEMSTFIDLEQIMITVGEADVDLSFIYDEIADFAYLTNTMNRGAIRNAAYELISTLELGEVKKTLTAKLNLAQSSRDHLVKKYENLVLKITSSYLSNGFNESDLAQAGRRGLMTAVDKFDHRRDTDLFTYAPWWIRQAMIRTIQDQCKNIRTPVYIQEESSKYEKAKALLFQQLEREPTEKDFLKAGYKFNFKLISAAQKVSSYQESLDDPEGEFNDCSRYERVKDENCLDSSELYDPKDLRKFLNRVLTAALKPKEEFIIRVRHGFHPLYGYGKIMHLKEAGKVFGISGERARQIEAKALKKLRHPLRKKQLEVFYD